MGGRSETGKTGIVGRTTAAAQARGVAAEALAEALLSRHGVRILGRRLRCRGGEIDLVGLDGDTLVFVEVRLRAPGRFGDAAESITATKQRRIIHAAQWWLSGAGQQHAARAMRFDAVLLDGLDPRRARWLRAAFDSDAW